MRTLLEATASITTVIPTGWGDIGKKATAKEVEDITSGLCETLIGMGALCNGNKRAIDSVATTINERIKALAVTKKVNADIIELAKYRGVDVDNASPAEITIASTSEEIGSLIAIESLITTATIKEIVTEQEMGEIQEDELKQSRGIRDPLWHRDLMQFVNRSLTHPIQRQDVSGLWIIENVVIKLDTIRAEVDENGEVCAWLYEEPVI